jgi:hypothetical protein
MVAAPIAAFLGDPLDGGRAALRTPLGAVAPAEDGGRRLFCFAMQRCQPGVPIALLRWVGCAGGK